MTEVLDGETVPVAAGHELATVPMGTQDALVIRREPAAVLAEASRAAACLMDVMAKKPKKVMMGDEQYIESEDWQTIGHFYDCTARLESDDYVEYGDAHGWEATCILVGRCERILGRATAMCMDDEEKWSNRPKYEFCQVLKPGYEQYGSIRIGSKTYARREDNAPTEALIWEPNPNKPGKSRPQSEKVLVGEEKVPTFQLRSMAQTRAAAKVHRMVLGFVPVLAGYSATPAEEMVDAERVPNEPTKPATSQPSPTQAAQPTQSTEAGRSAAGFSASPAKPATTPGLISQPVVKAFWTWVESRGFATADVAMHIRTKYKVKTTEELTPDQLDEVKAWVKNGGNNPGAPALTGEPMRQAGEEG